MRLIHIFLLLAICTQFACSNKQMNKLHKQHSQTINTLLGENISAEQKIEGLANTYIHLFEEALDYSSSKKAYQHISKFSKSHKGELKMLIGQVEDQMAQMSFEQKASYFLSLSQKDYIPRLMKLLPQVEKKIGRKLSSLSFVSKIIKLFKPESLLDSILK